MWHIIRDTRGRHQEHAEAALLADRVVRIADFAKAHPAEWDGMCGMSVADMLLHLREGLGLPPI